MSKRKRRTLNLKKRHIRVAESTAYRLPLPVHSNFKTEMKRLRTLAERWGVVEEIQKQIGDYAESASMAARYMIFLGVGFNKRPRNYQIRTYRHELSHILAQRILGFLYFLFLYKFQRYRWALEVSAQSEVVVTMMEQGESTKTIKNHAERYANSIIKRDGLYKFSRLDLRQARDETIRVLLKAATMGRPRIK